MTEQERLELQELEELESLEAEVGAKAPKASQASNKPQSKEDVVRGLGQELQSGRLPGLPGTEKPGWANAAALSLIPGAPAGAGILSKIGRGALTGAATAEATGPEAGSIHLPDARRSAKGAATGGITAGAMGGLESLLKGSADRLMQVAVGRKKYTPGVGTELADQGLMGTRGMMQKQVGRRLTDVGGDISEAASQITEPVNARQIAQGIQSEASRPLMGASTPSAEDLPKLNKIQEFTQDIVSRGQESGADALGRRIAAGGRSYRGKEDPLQSLVGQLSKMEQSGYSKALKEAATKTSPELGERLAASDKAYGALKRAEKALSEEPSLSLMSLLARPTKFIPGSTLGASLAGQATSKAGKATGAMTDPLIRALTREDK